MRRAVAIVAALMLAGVACSSPEPVFTRESLPDLVLAPEHAPQGTTFIDGESGYLRLEAFAEDPAEEQDLRDAGFEVAYLNLFWDPELRQEGGLDPTRAHAFSFAILFGSAEEADQGLAVIEADTRADGSDLEDYPAGGLGRKGFALIGALEPDRPPGVVFAWTVGNAVQVIIAAGAPGAINPAAVKVLAERMLRRAR